MPKDIYKKENDNYVKLQPLSRYIYSKVTEATTKFITLLLTPNEILFLEKYDVPYYKVADTYQVDANRLKTLFCH